jgi:beta-phosphoglucomutase-like phosphatase (HAD superfamily)
VEPLGKLNRPHTYPTLVICDFDNTLVESETVNADLFVRFFSSFAGITSDNEDQQYVDSSAFVDVIRHYMQKYRQFLKESFEESIIQRFLEYKETDLSSRELRKATGIEELNRLSCPRAIVSGSYTREISIVSRAANLDLSNFNPILGSDMYFPWKPDPAGFHIAAIQHRVDPQSVYVLEDSIGGLKAAHEAGMVGVFIEEFSVLSSGVVGSQAEYCYTDIATFVKALPNLS